MQLKSRSPGVFWEYIGIAILFNIGVCQPLYELLSRNVEFFVAHGSKPIDVLFLILILSFLFPLILIILIFLVRKLNLTLGRIFYAALMIILTTFVLTPLLKKLEILDGILLISIALILSCTILLIAKRLPAVRLFFRYLSLAVLAIPLVFLSNQSVWKFIKSTPPDKFKINNVSSKIPVIVVVFDELPLLSLLDKDGNIDEIQFPNFARFQKNSLWFRNATTVGDETSEALSAILSGKYPDASRLPILRDYPENLFTLLAGSYQLKVIEPVTKLCPENLNLSGLHQPSLAERMKSVLSDLTAVYLQIIMPEKYVSKLPSVKQTWKDFWSQTRSHDQLVRPTNRFDRRENLFEKFIELIQPSQKPSLYFLHIMLPHVPWEYLPSGKHYNYRSFGSMGVDGLSPKDETWTDDTWVVRRAYQRHILQLRYVDLLIGKFIKRLEDVRLYEKALIVMIADHGASFRAGESFRSVTDKNYHDILHVPLFIKLPGKNKGSIVDRSVESVDILPTIAQVLGVDSGFKMDGRSLLSDFNPGRTKKRIFKTIFAKKKDWMEFDSDITALNRLAQDQTKLLEEDSVDTTSLIKTSTSSNSDFRIELNDKDSFEHVDLNSNFIPVFIVGRIIFREPQSQRILLGVWINGKFQGITRTFSPDISSSSWLKTLWLKQNSKSPGIKINFDNVQGFGILVPETSFSQGKNDVKIIPVGKQENGILNSNDVVNR